MSTEETFRPGQRLTLGVAARLARYLQVLTQARKQGRSSISSQEISEYTNVNATQIRRDLSAFGKFGKRGVGYNVEFLIGEMGRILHTEGEHNIALVGAGRLGEAIASNGVFADHGFDIVAVFDRDPEKQGGELYGLEVQAPAELASTVRERKIVIGVIAVPAESAQDAADELVRAGIKILFNYSDALIDTPSDVVAHQSSPLAELLPSVYFMAS